MARKATFTATLKRRGAAGLWAIIPAGVVKRLGLKAGSTADMEFEKVR